MELNEFLQWLLTSGGIIIAVSWMVERMAWFQLLNSDKKEWSFFGMTAVVWVLSYLTVNFVPAGVLEAISPYFAGVSGLFITVVVGKLFHKADK